MPIVCRVCKSQCYIDNLLSYSNMPCSAQGFLKLEDLESDSGSDIFITQCSSCGLVQLDNVPVAYYKEVIRASAFSDEMRGFRSEQFKLWVKKYSLVNKKILEVGCGNGEYLEILSQLNVKASGIEYSKSSVEYCQQKKLNVFQGFLGDKKLTLHENSYEGFICLSFMEHWPNPNDVLNSLRNSLNEGFQILI